MKNRMPAASIGAVPDMRCDLHPGAMKRWNNAIQAKESGENVISILDVIGEDFWGEGVTAKRVAAALRRIGNQDVVVDINSPGGDFFEGLAIYNLLREHEGSVRIRVLGLAASAASIIAMAGDEVEVAKSGFLMIHNVWTVAMGDRNAMASMSEELEVLDEVLAEIYTARTGMKHDEITAMLDRETFISGKNAADMGFADRNLPGDEVQTVQNRDEKKVYAMRELERIIAREGSHSRKEGRELINALKLPTQDAGDGMQDAAIVNALQGLLTEIKAK